MYIFVAEENISWSTNPQKDKVVTGHTRTFFAPAERDSKKEVLRQKEQIEASEFLDKVLAGTPFMFFIINDKRQVVYSNYLLLEQFGYESMNDVVGLRPGELFLCIYADEGPGGCGTAEQCRYCGALQVVLESKETNELVTQEATIDIKSEDREIPLSFEVSSKPFEWNGESYFIITMVDISALKKKELIEKTFFHDIKNKAGTISGFLNLLQNRNDDPDKTSLFELVDRGMVELLEEIDYQRQLIRAENGDLEVSKLAVPVQETLENVSNDFVNQATMHGIVIQKEFSEPDIIIQSDPVLLRRILGNLVKNALEASKDGDIVTVGYEKNNRELRFYVSNPAVMPKEVQFQVFHRYYSTKGTGRGIGTYSVKLFSEDYLNGKVYFTSKEIEGTVFSVILPLNKN